jgi:hypothetical protein
MTIEELYWGIPHTHTRHISTLYSRQSKVPVLFLIEHYAMKTYWGSGGIVPCILGLGTRWK